MNQKQILSLVRRLRSKRWLHIKRYDAKHFIPQMEHLQHHCSKFGHVETPWVDMDGYVAHKYCKYCDKLLETLPAVSK